MIAIISHDAGGAEILSSWLKQNNEPFMLTLSGPAIKIFKRKLGKYKNHTLNDSIKNSNLILCGTSWKSDLEKKALVKAKKNGKKVIAFLDHWTNYSERFQFKGVKIFPDEIWVADKYAKNIAKKFFPTIKITLKKNPYLEDIKKEFKLASKILPPPNENDILYVCEPIRDHAIATYKNEFYWGYTEFEALNFFLKHLDVLKISITKIIIRPHPSDPPGKYNFIKDRAPSLISIDNKKTLVEQILSVNTVVGCGSMALIVALLAGKRVISTIPPEGKGFELPYKKIELLKKMI